MWELPSGYRVVPHSKVSAVLLSNLNYFSNSDRVEYVELELLMRHKTYSVILYKIRIFTLPSPLCCIMWLWQIAKYCSRHCTNHANTGRAVYLGDVSQVSSGLFSVALSDSHCRSRLCRLHREKIQNSMDDKICNFFDPTQTLYTLSLPFGRESEDGHPNSP